MRCGLHTPALGLCGCPCASRAKTLYARLPRARGWIDLLEPSFPQMWHGPAFGDFLCCFENNECTHSTARRQSHCACSHALVIRHTAKEPSHVLTPTAWKECASIYTHRKVWLARGKTQPLRWVGMTSVPAQQEKNCRSPTTRELPQPHTRDGATCWRVVHKLQVASTDDAQ